MAYKLQTEVGRAIYRRRKCTVEPVFGCLKEVLGFRQFSLRGLEAAAGEWCLLCLARNLKRLHVLTLAQQRTLPAGAAPSSVRPASAGLCAYVTLWSTLCWVAAAVVHGPQRVMRGGQAACSPLRGVPCAFSPTSC